MCVLFAKVCLRLKVNLVLLFAVFDCTEGIVVYLFIDLFCLYSISSHCPPLDVLSYTCLCAFFSGLLHLSVVTVTLPLLFLVACFML